MTINSKVKDALIFSATIILGLFLLDLYMGYKIFDSSFGINMHFTQYKFLNACYEIKEKGLLKFLLGWHLIIYILIIPGIVAYSYPLYYFIRYRSNPFMGNKNDDGKDLICSNDKKSLIIVFFIMLITPQIYLFSVYKYGEQQGPAFKKDYCDHVIWLDKIK